MTLSLRQLRYFVAIADAGALARAAEILNVAQSALSHHMSEIEAELGVQLLDRLPRGVALTAAGKRLYEHATLIVAAMIKAEADVRTFTELATGPISLGLTHTVAAASGLEIMKAVGIACPAVHLMITEGLSPGLTDRLLAGDLDFALVFNPAADTRLARDPLLREELFLVGLADIIGPSNEPVAFADIPQGAVLGLSPPSSRAIIQAHILRNRITPSPKLEIDSLGMMRRALEAGLGCAILARSTVATDLLENRIHARPIVDPTLTRDLNLIMRSDRPQTRAFTEVRRVLNSVIREEVVSGRWLAESLANATDADPAKGRLVS